MLNMSEQNKTWCFNDSIEKPFILKLYAYNMGRYVNFTTLEDIVLESAEINEGISESTTFALGSYSMPTFKISTAYTGISYKNTICVPMQKIGVEPNIEYVAYFVGYVKTETVSDDGLTTELEIETYIADVLNTDVLSIVSAGDGKSAVEILGNVTNSVGIKVDKAKISKAFYNANLRMRFEDKALPDELLLSDFLRQFGEFVGGHINFKTKEIISSNNLNNYTPKTDITIDIERINNNNNNNMPPYLKPINFIQNIDTNVHIDTGIKPDDTTVIQLKFQISGRQGGTIVGNIIDYNEADSFRFFNYNNSAYLDYGSGNGYNRISGGTIDDSVYEVEIGNRYVKNLQTDKIIIRNEEVKFNEKDYTLWLFSQATDPENTFIGKLYYCKIFKGQELKAYYIPAYNSVSGSNGLYDNVSQKFFGGTFLGDTPHETHTIPYFIDNKFDKKQVPQFSGIELNTTTGNGSDRTYYEQSFNRPNVAETNIYKIEKNLFFEGVSSDYRQRALVDVGSYLSELDFYNAELDGVYAPFLEPNDILVYNDLKYVDKNVEEELYYLEDNTPVFIYTTDSYEPSLNGFATVPVKTVEVPKHMVEVENINFDTTVYNTSTTNINLGNPFTRQINDTGAFTNTFNISFKTFGITPMDNIFAVYSKNPDGVTTSIKLMLQRIGNSMVLYAYGNNIYEIPYVPFDQRINLSITFKKMLIPLDEDKTKFKKEYETIISGLSNYKSNEVLYQLQEGFNINDNIVIGGVISSGGVGSGVFDLYSFSCSENGQKLYDLQPVKDNSTQFVGLYDKVGMYQATAIEESENFEKHFFTIKSSPFANYEPKIAQFPILTANAQGIHSQRATYSCTSTDIK